MSMNANPSNNFLVRLKTRQVLDASLVHLVSYLDPTVASDTLGKGWVSGCLSGATEWWASSPQGVLTLAWDWILADDGALQAAWDVFPRTNVQLVDEMMRPLTLTASKAGWEECLQSLDWRAQVWAHIKKVEISH